MKRKHAEKAEENTATAKAKEAPPAGEKGDGVRETVESVVVAFILAFLFRTFEAEAFVIPTGSMAETLMGRHKDLVCEKCGYAYRVSASDEVDSAHGIRKPGFDLVEGTCPMCRYTMDLRSPLRQLEYPSYNGDRILVAKFPYELHEPERWDVIVFKEPNQAHINFIKRLVGLPGESVKILNGDIFIKRPGEEYSIARKEDLRKLQAVLQPVYDNDYVLPSMLKAGWPARWQPWPNGLGEWLEANANPHEPVVTAVDKLPPGTWTTRDGYKSFQTDGTAAGEVWLRYQHTVPGSEDWDELQRGRPAKPLAWTIEDFSSYNRGTMEVPKFAQNPNQVEPPNWVGDLVVACELQVGSHQGQAVLELVEGRARFQCRIDLKTGQARLSILPVEPFRPMDANSANLLNQQQPLDAQALAAYAPQAMTSVKGPGTYRLAFGNADDQLVLWVDGKPVQFDSPTTFQPLGNTVPGTADFSPVGLASDGAKLSVDRLILYRDIFYVATNASYSAPRNNPRGVEFYLDEDQFFVLGDNSQRSFDARMWPYEKYVHRDLLIGKALYVYWPHSWNEVPGTEIPFPFYPNFARMGFVR
jgi:signal peptidase I